MTTIDALFAAIAQGDAESVTDLLGASPELANAQLDGISPLRAAAYAGHAELVGPLRSLGARPDAFDAATIGDLDCLRELLDQDPEVVRALAGDGFSALHLAAWFGQVGAAELLLAKGADIERVASNGTELRPLHSAAAGGHEVIVHLLLDRGADIEATQSGGVRPIHSAAHRADATMVRLLLDRGADPSVATDDGRTPAELTDDEAVLALLPGAA
ncbi:ankyrin repeat domain-containing protein [Aquihabitans daechungensis]|uniref:ankyrin repeat domain-containing protein n=1 Tax=Aquihabitans daechungensis TaxID=1052257 RepID=UPI003BA112C6